MKMLGCFILLFIFLDFSLVKANTSNIKIVSKNNGSPLTEELFNLINNIDDNIIGFHLVLPKNDKMVDNYLQKPSVDLKKVANFVNQISHLRNMIEKDPDTSLKKRNNFTIKINSCTPHTNNIRDYHTDILLFSQPMNSFFKNKNNESLLPNNNAGLIALNTTRDTLKHDINSNKDLSLYPAISFKKNDRNLNSTHEQDRSIDKYNSFLEKHSRNDKKNNQDESNEGFSVIPCSNATNANISSQTSFLILRNNIYDDLQGSSSFSCINETNSLAKTAYLVPSCNSYDNLSVKDKLALVEIDPEDQLESEHVDNNLFVTRQQRGIPPFYKLIFFDKPNTRNKLVSYADSPETIKDTSSNKENKIKTKEGVSTFFSLNNSVSLTDNSSNNRNFFETKKLNKKFSTKKSDINSVYKKKITEIISLAKEKSTNRKKGREKEKIKLKKREGKVGFTNGEVETLESDTKSIIKLDPVNKENSKKKKVHIIWNRIKRSGNSSPKYYKELCTTTIASRLSSESFIVTNDTKQPYSKASVVSNCNLQNMNMLNNRSNRSFSSCVNYPAVEKDINLLIACPYRSHTNSIANPVMTKYSPPRRVMNLNMKLQSDVSQLGPSVKFRINDVGNSSYFHRKKHIKLNQSYLEKTNETNSLFSKFNIYHKLNNYPEFNSKSNYVDRLKVHDPKEILNEVKSKPDCPTIEKTTTQNVRKPCFNNYTNSLRPQEPSNNPVKGPTLNNKHPDLMINELPIAHMLKTINKAQANLFNATVINEVINASLHAFKTIIPSIGTTEKAYFTVLNQSFVSNPTSHSCRNMTPNVTEFSASLKTITTFKSIISSVEASSSTNLKLVTTEKSNLSKLCNIPDFSSYSLTSNGTVVVNNGSMKLFHNHSDTLSKNKIELLQMPSGEIMQFFNTSTGNPLTVSMSSNRNDTAPLAESTTKFMNISKLKVTSIVSINNSFTVSTSTKSYITSPIKTQFFSRPTNIPSNSFNWSSYCNAYYKQFPYNYNISYYNNNNYLTCSPETKSINNILQTTTGLSNEEAVTSVYNEYDDNLELQDNMNYYQDFSPVISVNIFPIVPGWRKPHVEGLALVKQLFRSKPIILKNKEEQEKLPNYLSELFDIGEDKSEKKKFKFDDKVQKKLETILTGKCSINDVLKYKLQNILNANKSKTNATRTSDKIS